MPRLIFKCPYLAPSSSGDRGGYAIYIATRDGVEVIPFEKRDAPVTVSQQELIQNLLRDFPAAKDSFEYDDYLSDPTIGNASEFITRALEDNYAAAQGREGYVSYIPKRPNAARVGGSHGLFGLDAESPALSRVADEVRNHPGNIWTPILSLRREDAAQLGYDNAAGWKALLTSHAAALARWLKIPPEDFVWYAAFHDEGHHPHAHMLCYSRNPAQGFLTVEGIRGIKSELTRDIFRHDLEEIYRRQTMHRSDVGQAAEDALRDALLRMGRGVLDSAVILEKMEDLAGRLQFHGGKLVYGYLRPPVKALVDAVVDELEKDPRVEQAYAKWLDARREIVQGYTNTPEPETPLARRKEFKQIRNLVVDEAVRLMRGEFTLEYPLAVEDAPENDDGHGAELPDNGIPELPAPTLDRLSPALEPDVEDTMIGEPGTDDDWPPGVDAQELPGGPVTNSESVVGASPFVEWTDEYKAALGFLYGTESLPPNFDNAYSALLFEAEVENVLAMHDLGRMFAKGLGRDIDMETAQEWYTKALIGFHAVEADDPDKYVEYRIGKMYNAGLGTGQNHAQAAAWFRKAAGAGYKYAQYSLGGLYRDGQGVPRDHARAYELFEQSTEQDFPYASFECGKMLRDGFGTEKDDDGAGIAFREAFDGFLKLDAERPDDNLQYRLGWMLLTGTGVEKNTGRAAEYFEKAAEQNNVYAQYQLAKLLLEQSDADPSALDAALGWLFKAADAGHDTAQYALGKLYLEDERIQDIPASVHWLTLAATPCEQNPAGNLFAQYRLGKLILAGNEIERDVGAAIGWLTLSVEQGNEFAAYQLGKLFLVGELVEKDAGLGVRWMEQAVEAGNPHAQYALGKFFLFGDAEYRDEGAAIHWLEQSAAQGNIYAAFLLKQQTQWRRGAALMAGTRLLYGLSRIFSETRPYSGPPRFQLDQKRRRELRQKKGGRSIRQFDREQDVSPS